MPKIYLIDVTNRDGVQTAKLGLSKLEKTMINVFLNDMGVFQSEFGFPTTRHEIYYLRANLELAEMGVLKPLRLGGWIRAIPEDVEITFRNLPEIKHLNLSISTSDQMINGKFQGRKTRDDVIREMTEAVDAARACGAETIGVNAEDASRTDIKFLTEFGLAAKEHGADRLRYCDTLGYDNPFTIYDSARILAEKVGLPIELHCHDDLGMAVANSITGAMGVIDGGQDAYINTTINGIGERAGNAPLHEVVVAIDKNLQRGHGIDMHGLYDLTRLVERCSGIFIPPHAPIVGLNAFRHESGIHVDGILKNSQTYTGVDPFDVRRDSSFVLGKHTGTRTIRYLLDQRGFKADKRALEDILQRVKERKTKDGKEEIQRMAREMELFYERCLGFPMDRFWEIVEGVLGKDV